MKPKKRLYRYGSNNLSSDTNCANGGPPPRNDSPIDLSTKIHSFMTLAHHFQQLIVPFIMTPKEGLYRYGNNEISSYNNYANGSDTRDDSPIDLSTKRHSSPESSKSPESPPSPPPEHSSYHHIPSTNSHHQYSHSTSRASSLNNDWQSLYMLTNPAAIHLHSQNSLLPYLLLNRAASEARSSFNDVEISEKGESSSPECMNDKLELRSADTTNGNGLDRKRISRPLTGKHVRHGTGASPSTLITLRNMIKERQRLKEIGAGSINSGKGRGSRRNHKRK